MIQTIILISLDGSSYHLQGGGGEGGVDNDSEINFKFCLLSTRTLSGGFAKIGRDKTKLLINHRKKVKG